MTAYEMHVLFRTLGQQQGLQQVRGILAESIDSFLYESIIQTMRLILLGNTQPSKEVVTPQYTKIGVISSLGNLLRTEEQNISLSANETLVNLSLANSPFVYTNFAIKYKDDKKYACRIIEHDRIYDTLNDYLNRASHEYPIVALYNGNTDKLLELNLFTGDSQQDVVSIITSYIKMPAKVHYGSSTDFVNCDLPEHLHTSIVEYAVKLWFESLGLSSQPKQTKDNNQ